MINGRHGGRSSCSSCGQGGNDRRRDVNGSGLHGDEPTGLVFPDLEPESVLFDFELGEFVLAHEVENMFQLIEIHQGERREVRS